jgi:hypothetical protein
MRLNIGRAIECEPLQGPDELCLRLAKRNARVEHVGLIELGRILDDVISLKSWLWSAHLECFGQYELDHAHRDLHEVDARVSALEERLSPCRPIRLSTDGCPSCQTLKPACGACTYKPKIGHRSRPRLLYRASTHTGLPAHPCGAAEGSGRTHRGFWSMPRRERQCRASTHTSSTSSPAPSNRSTNVSMSSSD